jgi:hypothetical protein
MMATPLLVGSRAANFHFPGFRRPHDWDFIMPLRGIYQFTVDFADRIEYLHTKNEWKFGGKLKTGQRFEIEVADYNPSAMMLWDRQCEFQETVLTEFIPIKARVVSPAYLGMMKRSHLHWNVHWDKSIRDYHRLKARATNHIVGEPELEFYRARLQENEAKWGKPQTNLNVSNDAFFDRSKKIGRKFEHDQLHEAVKYYDVPLYQSCKRDQSKANLDRTIFDQWDQTRQERLVREEAMVIALERKIIPQMLGDDPSDVQAAYSYALRRICTNLTSGWFRQFAIENWPAISKPDVDYVQKFQLHFGITR